MKTFLACFIFNLYSIIQDITAYSCIRHYNDDEGIIHSDSINRFCRSVEFKLQPYGNNVFLNLQWLEFTVNGDMPECHDDNVVVYTG